MKRTVLVALVLALGLCGLALAADDYWDTCTEAACYPFRVTNSYVQQKAVNLAYTNNAAVGDEISLIDTIGNQFCEDKSIEWEVNHVPTLSYTDLTYEGGYCTTRGNQ